MEYGFTPWVKKEVYLPNNDVLKENVLALTAKGWEYQYILDLTISTKQNKRQ